MTETPAPVAADGPTLWVVVRSTGEYSDRVETPIRYCVSEQDAQAAVELASVEAQRDVALKPVYRSAPSWGYKDAHDCFWPDNTSFATIRREGLVRAAYPEKDAIEAQNEKWRAEYDAACLALGHVDPVGSWSGDEYYYAPVTLWTPAA